MGISFELTEEQERVRAEASDFARREIAPMVPEIDETDDPKLLLELWRKMAREPYRYTGMFIPEEYGGKPRKILDICLIMEEITAISRGAIAGALIEACGIGTTPVVSAGSEEQKRKYLPPIARGEGISCFALTEPGIGSDAQALSTRAVLEGDYYILNGRKRYASFAHVADFTVVFAKTDPEKGARGISAFIVPKGTPGFIVKERVPCIGMRGHQDEEVSIENVRLPKDNLIGREGEGLIYALSTLDKTRTTLTAGYIGLARAALEDAVKFAKARKAFGKTISEFQAISFPLTEIWIGIEAARLLVWRAAWLSDKGVRHTVETAQAKALASEILIRATNMAVETHGGFGCTKRFPVERMLRDARIWVFAQGAPNIQKLIAMRELFKRLEPPEGLVEELA